jgi:hypothetical protein
MNICKFLQVSDVIPSGDMHLENGEVISTGSFLDVALSSESKTTSGALCLKNAAN